MRRTHHAGVVGAAFICSLFVLSASFAAVVDVDAAAKSATKDTDSITRAVVRVVGEQVGVLVQSDLTTPQTVMIRFKGIKDQDYDLYVNGTYAGVKPGKELIAGVKWEIPGTVTPIDLMRCMKSVKARAEAEYARLQTMKGTEPMRAGYTYSQACGWVRTGLQSDVNYRSIEVKITPAGTATRRMVFATRMNAEETVSAAASYCRKFQMARATMYGPGGLKDPILRNEVVANLTPVDLTASCSQKNGKITVTATVVNNCNLPISGAISITAPKGWKTSAKPAAFNDLKSAKTFKTTFDLAPAAQGAAAPESIPVAASISLVEGRFAAKFTLSADAKSAAKAN